MQPVTQPTATPVPKVAAVGISGIILTLIVAVAGVFNIHLPASLGDNVTALVTAVVALVSLVQFVVGYVKKDKVPVQPVQTVLPGTKIGGPNG